MRKSSFFSGEHFSPVDGPKFYKKYRRVAKSKKKYQKMSPTKRHTYLEDLQERGMLKNIEMYGDRIGFTLIRKTKEKWKDVFSE